MTTLSGRSWGAWVALTVGILASACAAPPPAGSLAVTPTAFRLAHAESAGVRLTWTPSRRLTEKTAIPTVFVHLIHPTAGTVRTFDHRLPGGRWEPDLPVNDQLDIALSGLAEPLPEGTYKLAVGLYDEASGYRWPLLAEGEDLGRRAYGVATLEVALSPVPDRFRFSGDWRAVEPGTTMQIVAWRWLQSGGEIQTYAAGGTVQLHFQMGILPENAAGAPATSVAIDGDCLLAPALLAGRGAVDASLPLRQGSQGERCTIRLLAGSSDAGPWVRLDGIDWRPPAG
jgi:hypothetical protein